MTDTRPPAGSSAPAASGADGRPAQRPIEDAFPLTGMQQALLVRCVSYPDRPLYVGQWWAVLDGDLDPEALAASWQTVVDRHTALRCGFHWDLKDHPFQVVHRRAALPVQRSDWSEDRAGTAWRERLESFLAQDRARPFDIRKPPLMRIALFRLAPARHLVVWTRHHLVVDGWSLGVILDEVFELYRAARAGEPHRLTPAPAFRAYVDWDRSLDRSVAAAHWRAVLADCRPDLGDRAENARPAGTAPDVQMIDRHLDDAATAGLTTLARAARVTLNTVAQAGWAIVESRMSGRDVVLFGAVETVRPPHLVADGAADLVGMQIQVQPVLARVDRTPLRDWLTVLQEAAVAARAAGGITMDAFRDLLGLPRDGLPYDSVVGFQNYPLDEAGAFASSGLALAESGDITLPDMPLNLMIEQREGLCLRLMYDRSRYGPQEAALRLDMLVTVLQAMPAAAAVPVAAIDALPPAVTNGLLAQAGTPLAVPDGTVVDMILGHAERRPEAPAISHGGRRTDYGRLLATAAAIAGRLAANGVGPGMRVGLHLERTPLAIAAILGVQLRGASYVPFDLEAPDDRKAFMIAEAGLAGMLTAEAERVAGVPTIAIGDLEHDTPAAIDRAAWHLPAAADEAYVIFTSGSTGRPKGVVIAHRNLGSHVASSRAADPDRRDRSFLLTFPLMFDGSVTGIVNTLTAGGMLVLPRPVEAGDPDRLAALIRTERVSHTVMLPSQWNLLLSAGTPTDLTGVRRAVVAGEACPRDLVERHHARLPDTLLCNEYGPTETTICATRELCSAGAAGPVPIGRAIPGARAYVVDRQNRLCPPGAVGELLIAGPIVGRGYARRPDLTAERFTANPFHHEPDFQTVYRTGDRVAAGFDGRLWFHGRTDEQVKVDGYRIELAEIAACLQDHPAIAEATAVVHRADPRAPALIVAHVGGPDLPSREAILQHARRMLPAYMVPRTVVLHERLPRNATGKVDRDRLPEPRPQAASAAPEGELEQAVATIWRTVLGVQTVGRFDDFFALGGGSLAAMQVVSRLRREHGLAVEPIDVFETPRLSDFALRLAGRRSEPGPAIRGRQRVRIDLDAAPATGSPAR